MSQATNNKEVAQSQIEQDGNGFTDDPSRSAAPPWKRPSPVKNISPASLGCVSEIMLLDSQCGLLVHKRSLHNLPLRKAIQVFSKHMKAMGKGNLNPYFRDDGVDFFYLSKSDIFLVAVHPSSDIDNPITPIVCLELLQRVYEILKDCIGTVNEAYVSINRMLVFEVLDEVLSFGFGFTSSYTEIKPHLTLEPVKPKVPQQDELATRFFGINAADKSRAQAAASQPKDKIPNSAYINIVEGLSAVLGPDGEVQSSELWGKLTLISTLERPAPIAIHLNEDLVLRTSDKRYNQFAGVTQIENPSYHACVDTTVMAQRKVLRVLPPPEQTRLMVYTLSDPSCIRIPIILIPSLTEIAGTRDQNLSLRLINLAEGRTVASYVRVKVKLPKWMQSISTTKSGEGDTSQFNAEERSAEWELKKFRGGSETSILFRLICPSDKSLTLSDVGPISLSFNITNFSASGLMVRTAYVEGWSRPSEQQQTSSHPECFFGVSTKAASYTVRTTSSKNL